MKSTSEVGFELAPMTVEIETVPLRRVHFISKCDIIEFYFRSTV